MPEAPAEPCLPSNRVPWDVLEARLTELAQKSKNAASEAEYRALEALVFDLFRPLALAASRGMRRAADGGGFDADVRLSHFHFHLLRHWRKRVEPKEDRDPAYDPHGPLKDQLIEYFNAAEDAPYRSAAGAGREEHRRARRSLRELYVQPYGGPLCELPKGLLRRLAADLRLRFAWREILDGFLTEEERYDPLLGGFLGWVVGRFRLRLPDMLGEEEHVVRRTQRTEGLRRRADAAGWDVFPDAWGYQRLDRDPGWLDAAADEDRRRLENRLEVECLLASLAEPDRKFLTPLVAERVEDLKGLAAYWRISPAAVSKRLSRIRRAAGGKSPSLAMV